MLRSCTCHLGRTAPDYIRRRFSFTLHSDIDLVIMSESMAYSNKINVLTALANTLKHSGITDKVTVISKAKVPIIKFITTHGRFSVDISINQENGIIAGNIINGFLGNLRGSHTSAKGKEKEAGEIEANPQSIALRALVLLTKLFLSQRSMNEVYTGGLGSYSIVCLCISFLQMHPKIRYAQIDPNKNLGVLVMEFFELYGWYFNYEEVGISLRDGGNYYSKRARGWVDGWGGSNYGGRGQGRGMLSIEDPADPSELMVFFVALCVWTADRGAWLQRTIYRRDLMRSLACIPPSLVRMVF